MSEFKLSITLGNEAMQTPRDVAEALRGIAARVHYGQAAGFVRDENGNTVGSFSGDFEPACEAHLAQ